ncbi:hypothetical protein B0H14DRAFT_3871897 [Mycena olivaceomarginata]|nr:hypothetical protein B0H14DRAFT_3871897 [Mycena olivaceomarginata]
MLTLVRDGNSRFNTADSITTTVWHSDCSFELQPAGLTAFWLLSQPETGGDTLYSSQATHTAVNSMCSKRGGVVRREPIEAMTRTIVGMKREESDLLLNVLYDHVAMITDHQVRIKWEPMSVVVWDNRITPHTATSDYAHLKARRHGARISAQAERPIPALDGLKMDD